MGKNVNLIGKRQGKLVCVEYLGLRKRKDGRNNKIWKCVCDCGNEKIMTSHQFNCGMTKSCGCLQPEMVKKIRYKGYNKKIYGVWSKMKDRCYNPNNPFYYNYGGRGICVCKEWLDDYYVFQKWALENGYQDGLTIDRADNDKGYSPDNCSWQTRSYQSNNKRNNRRITHDGETKTLAMWCYQYGAEYSRTRYRLDHGYSFEDAMTKKPYEKKED